jgi:PBS lyase HEAT-like repeat
MPRKSKFPFFRIEDIPSPEQVELWASRQEWGKVILAANAKNYGRPALLKADSTLMMAARLLEQHQSPESLQALISQFDRGTSGVRHEALRAIGNQRQPAALEFLKQFQAGTVADCLLRDEGVSRLTRHLAGERFELPPIPVPSRVAENPALHNKLEMLLDQLNKLPDRPLAMRLSPIFMDQQPKIQKVTNMTREYFKSPNSGFSQVSSDGQTMLTCFAESPATRKARRTGTRLPPTMKLF